MNLVDNIINIRRNLNGKEVDYNEIIKCYDDDVYIEKRNNKIICIINYTVEVDGGDDEYWGDETFEIERLLTDEEMLKIGSITQYDYDSGIKKYTYYDINVHWTEAEKIRTKEIDECNF
jgi:hypothetical protein